MNHPLWTRIKAIFIQSDDWGMCAWAPSGEAYEALHPLPYMHTRWSSGTLETPADLERLFHVLGQFRGGDDLPALFEPMYIVSSPDYAAIEANGFTDYADISYEHGVSPGWERGDLAAKAREGIARGVWHPGYHGRAHHFSPDRWIDKLARGDAWARLAFQHRAYVCESVPDRRPEYADMLPAEQRSWVAEGLDRFERAFGYRARSARNGDFFPPHAEPALRALAEQGVIGLTGDGRLPAPHDPSAGRSAPNPSAGRSAGMGLVLYPRPISFEPFISADHEDTVTRTLGEIEQAWAEGQPAVLSSHRRNYKSFDLADVDRNLGLLERLLTRVAREHPEAVYLCGDEVAQLERGGYSVVRRPYRGRLICRNYSGMDLSAGPIEGEPSELRLPQGEMVIRFAGDRDGGAK